MRSPGNREKHKAMEQGRGELILRIPGLFQGSSLTGGLANPQEAEEDQILMAGPLPSPGSQPGWTKPLS